MAMLETLNVGGTLFTCLRATLAGRPGTLLTSMYSGAMLPGVLDAGVCFIDRDPAHFPAILMFMRDGAAPILDSPAQRSALRAEACYFGCWGLVEAIDAVNQEHAELEAARKTRVLAEAEILGEVVGLLRAAVADQQASAAEEAAEQEQVAALDAELAAAHRQAAEAKAAAAATVIDAERLRQRQHAAALHWHELRDRRVEAADALLEARKRQSQAQARRLATVHLQQDAAPELPPLAPGLLRRPSAEPPIRDIAPLRDFEEWAAEEERREAAAAAGPPAGGGLGDFDLPDLLDPLLGGFMGGMFGRGGAMLGNPFGFGLNRRREQGLMWGQDVLQAQEQDAAAPWRELRDRLRNLQDQPAAQAAPVPAPAPARVPAPALVPAPAPAAVEAGEERAQEPEAAVPPLSPQARRIRAMRERIAERRPADAPARNGRPFQALLRDLRARVGRQGGAEADRELVAAPAPALAEAEEQAQDPGAVPLQQLVPGREAQQLLEDAQQQLQGVEQGLRRLIRGRRGAGDEEPAATAAAARPVGRGPAAAAVQAMEEQAVERVPAGGAAEAVAGAAGGAAAVGVQEAAMVAMGVQYLLGGGALEEDAPAPRQPLRQAVARRARGAQAARQQQEEEEQEQEQVAANQDRRQLRPRQQAPAKPVDARRRRERPA